MNPRTLLGILVCAVLGGVGCDFRLPDLSAYPPCQDGKCPTGCACLASTACVPESEPYDPRCCEAATCPECTQETGCPNPVCTCQRGVCLTPAGERDPVFCGEPNPTCLIDSDCDWGCTCEGGECAPPAGEQDPGLCAHGYTTCVEQTDCRVGCLCDGGRCWPEAADISYPYCAGQYQELLCRGSSITISDEWGLRGALEEAATANHPYGIAFSADADEIELSSDLPPVPSLVWIDGRAEERSGRPPVVLRGLGAEVGLRVAGSGVVLQNLKLVGFPDAAIVVAGSAQDVHLRRLRIGDHESPNCHGIRVESGASRIAIGRGREIGLDPSHCVTWETTPVRDRCDVADWDLNVIVGNTCDGIWAIGASDLLIEGTWIGFEVAGDCDTGGGARPEFANSGMGIRLENVQSAHIGMRHSLDGEISMQQDYRQGCVAVGRSGQGGVLIQGGGDIVMRCLILGDTPVMVPYWQNEAFGLKIEGNTGPVSYGAPAEALGFEAESANLIHVLTTPAIVVNNNQAPVWIRGSQVQSFGTDVQTSPTFLFDVMGAAAPVDLLHLSVLGPFQEAMVRAGTLPGVRFGLHHNFLAQRWPVAAPVVLSLSQATDIELHHNFKLKSGPWCSGTCPETASIPSLVATDTLTGAWDSLGFHPQDINCPVVDHGLDQDLDTNGALPGLYSGCCPDLGAFECFSADCRERDCTGVVCE